MSSRASPRNLRGEVDEQHQANFLVRGALQLLAQPEVEKIFWYTLHDDRTESFGLFRFGDGYTDYETLKRRINTVLAEVAA